MFIKFIACAHMVLLGIVSIATMFIFIHGFHSSAQQFVGQARSILHKQLFIDAPSDKDVVVKDGKYYWPQGPFPSVVLLPFVLIFGSNVEQGHVQILLIILLIIILIQYARRKGYLLFDSFFLCAAFIFGSVFIGIMTQPSSWYFAQVVAVVLLTFMLIEWDGRRSYMMLGWCEAALIATRPTAGIFGLYILYRIFFNKIPKHHKTIALLTYLLPIGVSLLLLGWFNWARFGSVVDTGYLTNNIGPVVTPLRNIGLFSIKHLPMNIYWYFLSSVEPVTDGTSHIIFPFIKYNDWGLSVLIISPFFLYVFRTIRYRNGYISGLWVVVVITLVLLLTYYSTGWYSFGPRYAADFMPLLYVLLLYAFPNKRLTTMQRSIVVGSAIINTYILYATRIL